MGNAIVAARKELRGQARGGDSSAASGEGSRNRASGAGTQQNPTAGVSLIVSAAE
ncbi:hypothetical protein [Rivularia sp. UHCC 0363]|uniref:hypothetical protein n=1 Tax=Rivularia sp. UHCC 0363 TaxID=3110244 RepID=UPI002B201BE6|nr:hypothetical protein [Rivularia sp. UHCC 0363]MEA5597376.1 hypothetical protein [Rivularia sp. UHCC 0363]